MALADSSIKKLNDELGTGRHVLETFRSETSEYLDKVSGNANYATFVSETEIGKELNSKLIALVDIAKNVGNDVERLLKTTQDFSDTQSRLNASISDRSGIGAWSAPETPTAINASQARDGVGFTITDGMVTIPGGTRIPGSATGGVRR